MFTEEQLETLASITATNEYRVDFARIVYYMDITVRGHCVGPFTFFSKHFPDSYSECSVPKTKVQWQRGYADDYSLDI